MKKIIGVLGVAVIAVTMFFNANAVSGSTTDTSLASLITMNTANAEDTVCLAAQNIETVRKVPETGKGCYRDASGADVLEGYATTCVSTSSSSSCQPLRCKTELVNCYVK